MSSPPPPTGAPSEAPSEADGPRWLTYRCTRCSARVYSGYTSSALERHLRTHPSVTPDFFHADCAVETPLAQADLRFDDGAPWSPPPGLAPKR